MGISLLKRIIIYLLPSGIMRTKAIIKYNIFKSVGDNFYFCPRKLPADPKLIKFHNNIAVATEVQFINHDVIQKVLNHKYKVNLKKYYGCIEIFDNVFIGARSIILPNIKIGPNVILAAGTIVYKDIIEPGVYGKDLKKICEYDEILNKRIKWEKENYMDDNDKFLEKLWLNFYKKDF